MTKWEYLVVLASNTGGSENRLAPQIENGRLIKNWQKGPDIYEYMNELGAQGWELVATETTLRYVFKRQKE
ncbi:MAG: hypothetical protein JXA10_06985 [Anaerolineae bacterium]|nr:hypothetical protein [Anaerolineae bacterium]